MKPSLAPCMKIRTQRFTNKTNITIYAAQPVSVQLKEKPLDICSHTKRIYRSFFMHFLSLNVELFCCYTIFDRLAYSDDCRR